MSASLPPVSSKALIVPATSANACCARGCKSPNSGCPVAPRAAKRLITRLYTSRTVSTSSIGGISSRSASFLACSSARSCKSASYAACSSSYLAVSASSSAFSSASCCSSPAIRFFIQFNAFTSFSAWSASCAFNLSRSACSCCSCFAAAAWALAAAAASCLRRMALPVIPSIGDGVGGVGSPKSCSNGACCSCSFCLSAAFCSLNICCITNWIISSSVGLSLVSNCVRCALSCSIRCVKLFIIKPSAPSLIRCVNSASALASSISTPSIVPRVSPKNLSASWATAGLSSLVNRSVSSSPIGFFGGVSSVSSKIDVVSLLPAATLATPPIGPPNPAPAANELISRLIPSLDVRSTSGLLNKSNASCAASVVPSATPPTIRPELSRRSIPPLPLIPPSNLPASNISGIDSAAAYGNAKRKDFHFALSGSVSFNSPYKSPIPNAQLLASTAEIPVACRSFFWWIGSKSLKPLPSFFAFLAASIASLNCCLNSFFIAILLAVLAESAAIPVGIPVTGLPPPAA